MNVYTQPCKDVWFSPLITALRFIISWWIEHQIAKTYYSFGKIIKICTIWKFMQNWEPSFLNWK